MTSHFSGRIVRDSEISSPNTKILFRLAHHLFDARAIEAFDAVIAAAIVLKAVSQDRPFWVPFVVLRSTK